MPALLALIVAMFSLGSRPAPHVSDLAPDAFSGADALTDTRAFTKRFPDRQAGSPGDAGLADVVEMRFRTLGLETSRQRFFTDVDGEEQELSNVIGRLRGRSDREVVIMAHRDSAGRPGAASASGTAVLLELTQALDALDRTKTIVLVSTDGATADDAGARRFADHYRGSAKVDVALVLDDIGAIGPAPPVRGAVVDRLEPRVAGSRAHRRSGAASRDRIGGRVGVLARSVDAPGVAAHASGAGTSGALRHRRGDAHGAG